jgi:hypothetical protein
MPGTSFITAAAVRMLGYSAGMRFEIAVVDKEHGVIRLTEFKKKQTGEQQ